ncbi:MAG TPA: hypothetical protein PLE24_02825 [Chitinispirillaceae bacterium]|jgi:hypothetical protein|nr:hypothetical protein [Chitinispirillaceae bacterium]
MKLFNPKTYKKIQRARSILLSRARERHGNIQPCGSWDKSFTIEGNTLLFWYITPGDQSTHLVTEKLDKVD